MKNRMVYIWIVISLLLSSCEKSSTDVFNKSTDERLSARVNEYKSKLTTNKDGWILTVNSEVAGSFNHWIKFRDDQRVEMLSDVERYLPEYQGSSAQIKESSYSIKALQNIVLLFDTYNYIHIPADPQGGVNGGKNGDGLKCDFEFSFTDPYPYIPSGGGDMDLINIRNWYLLKGRYFNNKALLRKCTSEEAQAIQANGLAKNAEAFDNYMKTMKVPAIEVDGHKAELAINSRGASITYLDENEQVKEQREGGIIGKQALIGTAEVSDMGLFSELEFGSHKITGFKFENGKLCAVVDGIMDFDGGLHSGQSYPLFDNKKSVIPLKLGYGQSFSQVEIDPSQLENTISEPFLNDIFIYSQNKVKTGYSTFILEKETLSFILIDGKESMQLSLTYTNKGKRYSVKWSFGYQLNNDRTITFTDRAQISSSAIRYEPYLSRLLDYFCKVTYSTYDSGNSSNIVIEKIEPRTFKLDWAEVNTAGLNDPVGGFYPIEEPNNFCVGILKK